MKYKEMQFRIIFFLIIFFSFLSVGEKSQAANPILNFSDIVSGPKMGLNDGYGQGTIVTIWGNNLGGTQGTSKVYFRDSLNNSYESAHVYYWKNADGQLPGGPADLYSFHKMQEISFSIPSTVANGLGEIYVEVDGTDSNSLPFTIRAGDIYFVKTTGNNSSSSSGSWSAPWATLSYVGAGAEGRVSAGDIIYATDGVSESTELAILNSVDGTADSPISIIAYPNSEITLTGDSRSVIMNYYGGALFWNFAKLKALARGGTGVWAFKEGRIVGFEITDDVVTCADGWGGAIAGNSSDGEEAASGIKALGNYIHDFGCDSTGAGHHVFYLTNRGGTPLKSYELGWNYLKDNKVNEGLHVYDQTPCGDWTGPMNIHDNVVLNQRGYALDINGSCTDSQISMDINIYNNLFINSGIGPIFSPDINYFEAIHASGGASLTSHINIYHNTIYGYGEILRPNSAIGISHGGTFNYRNNLVVDTKDISFSSSAKSASISSNNLWYNGGDGNPLTLPIWDNSPLTVDPVFANSSMNDFTLQSSSPAINTGVSVGISRDLIGNPRDGSPDIGAFEYINSSDTASPSNPTGLSVE